LNAALVNAATLEAARQAASALARFYANRELYVEALAALRSIDLQADDDASKVFIAEIEYRLGRHDAALTTLADERLNYEGRARALRGMALARLGAYDAAKGNLLAGEAPSADLKSEFQLVRAAVGIETGDVALAERSLPDAGDLVPASAEAMEATFLRARLAQATGADPSRQLRSLARVGVEPYASRAAVALALREHAKGEAGAAETLDEVQALSLRWSGGEFERECLAAIATLATETDPEAAFAARRALVAYHPQSDEATKSRLELTKMLASLLDRDGLSPGAAARLFYENIEYAPPGREGDALIRRVADKLAALDLLADAAELLDHQVFNRLRGTERSIVAADLAQLYLDNRRPSEALRVIRSTRMVGLDDGIVERRRLLEAKALDRTGSSDAAMILLSGSSDPAALKLRADIDWRQGAWAQAGEAYRRIVRESDAPLNEAARESALRAAAAFLKAGDDDSLAELQRETAEILAGSPEGEIIQSLAEP
jgi:hypothetical protein